MNNTIASPHQQRHSNEAIRLVIDGEEISILPIDLRDPTILDELQQRISAAGRVTFLAWDRIANLSENVRDAVLAIATQDGCVCRFKLTRSDDEYPDAFAVTLALRPVHSDLREVAHLTAFAVAAAARCHPGAIPQAAEMIKTWQQQNRIPAERADMLARRIRAQLGGTQESNGRSPQQAADVVLAHLQEVRGLRGEDTSTCPPVRLWQDDWYAFNGHYWPPVINFEYDLLRVLQCTIDRELTTAFVAATKMNIAAKTVLTTANLRLPVYVPEDPSQPVEPRFSIVFPNGVVDLGEMLRTGRLPELTPHDPRLFATSCLEFEYSPDAACPLWLETLLGIFPCRHPNDHRIAVLQEFMGYCLMPWEMSLEAFAIFVGGGSNGKSTILNAITHMLGKSNVSHVALEGFGKDAHVFEMDGKMANIAYEMHRLQRVEEGTLKALVSGEPRQVDRKYKRPVTMYPSAKLIFATNNFPPFADTSNGVWRRTIALPFEHQFSGDNDDKTRKDRVLDELPGIFCWSLEGALRLMRQQRFTDCAVCDLARSEYRTDSDPFLQFVDECCEIIPTYGISCSDLYRAYHDYCLNNGRSPKGSSEFGKQLVRLPGVPGTPGITKDRFRTGSYRPWRYVGIRLCEGYVGSYDNIPMRTDLAGRSRRMNR